MSFPANNLIDKKIFKWYEIVGFIFIIASLLYLLFPKDKIVELILKEKGDDNLIIKYIENIKKYHDIDLKLHLVLFEKYLNTSKIDKAENELETIYKNFPNFSKKEFLKYKLVKTEYFLTKDEKKRGFIKKEIENILNNLIKNTKKTKQLKYIYKEALSFELYQIALNSIEKIIKNNNDLKWIKNAYKISMQTKNYKKAKKYLQNLIKKDPLHKKIYLFDLANIYIHTKEYKKASNIYYNLAQIDKEKSLKWLQKSAMFSILYKDYEIGAKRYIEAMIRSKDFKNKKRFFMEAIKVSLWGNKKDLAIKYIKMYKNLFIHDKECAIFMLKTALALEELTLANKISKDIAKRLK